MRTGISKSNFSLVISTVILGFISLISICYEGYYLSTDLPAMIKFNNLIHKIAIGYLVVILFHLSALILITILRFYKKYSNRSTHLLFIFGVLSLFFIAIEKIMFDEVGREIHIEWPVPGEIYIIYAGLIINTIFCISVIYYSIKILSVGKKSRAIPV